MILEYCSNGDLKKLLETSGGKLEENLGWNIFLQLIEGFKVLYEAGIIHRDIKPANILLKAENQVLISDFGFARFIDVQK